MPIYEYRCESCEHEFEAIQKMSDEPLKTCPLCEQDKLKKRVSAAAFRLKGGGWYETDFKSGNKKNLASQDKAPDNGSAPAAKDKASPPASGDAKSGQAKTAAPAQKSEPSSKTN